MGFVPNIDIYDIRHMYFMFIGRKAELFNSVNTKFVGYDDGTIMELRHLYPELKKFLIKYNNIRS